MTSRSYRVPAMSCQHCVRAISGELAKLPAVTEVTVDLKAKTVTVRGDASDTEVCAAIDRAGYDVAA
jgi:copper chaperone